MLIGLGAADMAAEKVRKMIDDFVEHGDISVEQGRELYGDVVCQMEQRGRAHSEEMRGQLRDMLREAGIPDRAQIGILEARIDQMEGKLDQLLARLSDREGGPSAPPEERT
jgi:polyhydroxyalkanoate synthesis regulator phasin